MNSVAAGIGAGLVSALLFAVVITGSPLALLLSYAAPLPVFIAALGWRHHAGLIAAVAGALALAVALRFQPGVAYAIGIALPAWGIAYLALLGRSDDSGPTEWYPLGRLMLWIAGTAALVTLVGALALAGDHETYRNAMERSIAGVLSGSVPGMPPPRLPAGLSVEDLAAALAIWAPLLAGASFVPMLAANLWLAAKAVHLSGRLPRPWPHLPSMALPREALVVMALAVAGAFLPGFIGFFAMAVLGAMASACLFNGLAAIHELSLGRPMRTGLLIGVYLGLVVGATIVAPLIMIFGFVECLFQLRQRRRGLPPSNPPQI